MPTLDLRQDAAALADDLIALRRQLHAIPEIGLQLPITQRAILSAIDGPPLEISTGSGCSSVTAVLRGASGQHSGTRDPASRDRPVVLLRGDMDALPVRETTGVPFAPAPDSPHAGAMHACGHDLHMAGLVGAVRLLCNRRDELPGDVVFMFQPGEEGYDGAGVMISEGVLDAAGRRADAAFGLHVFGSVYPPGAVAARPGPLMAASSGLQVRVVGAGGHGSMPHRAKDPIVVAAEMVTGLQTLATRQFDIFDPIVITVGSFHGGTRRNVIPDDAVFEATIRTFSAESVRRAEQAAVRLCEGIADAHGLTAEVQFVGEYPVTVNDPGQYAFARDVATELLGADRVVELPSPIGGSEDFSRVLQHVPGAYLFLGAAVGDPVTAAYNHSPQATFDESVLPDAAALLATLAAHKLAELAGTGASQHGAEQAR